jgi:hypothetical protein
MRRLASLLFVAACAGEPAAPVAAEPEGATTAALDGTASSTGQPSSGTDESSGESTDAALLDVPDTTGDGVPGCRKIDFLFVIDNSSSMADEQQRLIEGFPGFIGAVQETIREFDHHVMVVTPDTGALSYDPCENLLGTGRARDSAGNDCGLLDDFLHGKRYIDETHEDLEGAFSCIADVGIEGGGDEKVVWALADAITEHNGPGQCNEGFRRDDAILVVTIISDEEDNPNDGPPAGDTDLNSPGGPELWHDGLVEAAHGNDEAVVVLALVGDPDLPDGLCEPYEGSGTGAEAGRRLRKLAESLPYGSWASVCQDDYAPFFNQAIADIDSACANFVPPG